MDKNILENLIAAAKEFETTNELNWDGVTIDRDTLYESMAITALEIASSVENNEDRDAVLLSTLTSMMVENVVLKLRQHV